MKSLFTFYLKNFRVIHHLVFMLMTIGVFKISSLILPQFELFQLGLNGLVFQLIIVSLSFYYCEKALNKSGITDEYMKGQLEKFNK